MEVELVAIQTVFSRHVGVCTGNLKLQRGERQQTVVEYESASQIRGHNDLGRVLDQLGFSHPSQTEIVNSLLQFIVAEMSAGNMKLAFKVQAVGNIPGSWRQVQFSVHGHRA